MYKNSKEKITFRELTTQEGRATDCYKGALVLVRTPKISSPRQGYTPVAD